MARVGVSQRRVRVSSVRWKVEAGAPKAVFKAHYLYQCLCLPPNRLTAHSLRVLCVDLRVDSLNLSFFDFNLLLLLQEITPTGLSRMESENLRHIRRVRSLINLGSSATPLASWENARCPCFVFTFVNLCVLMAIIYVHNAGGGSFLTHFDLYPVFPENSGADNSPFPFVQSAATSTGDALAHSLPQAPTDQSTQEYESAPAAEAAKAGATGNSSTVLSTKSVLNAADDSRTKLTEAAVEERTKDVNSTHSAVQSVTLKPCFSLSWSPSVSVSAAQTWTSLPSRDVSNSSSHSASTAAASSRTVAPGETAKASVSATPSRASSVSSSGSSSFDSASAAAFVSLYNSTNVSSFVNNTTCAENPSHTEPAPGGQSLTTNVSSAISESTTMHDISTLPCPTLFIYPNVPVFDGGAKASDITLRIAFGKKQNYPGIYIHSQYNLAQLVMYRLHHSKHCRVTTNASAADLFIIPVLTAPKGSGEWRQACGDSKLWRKSTIHSDAGNYLSFLPHLNNQTANKHVFIVSKGHYYGRGGPCDWIPGNPPFSPVFRNIQRFAYSHTYEGHLYGNRTWSGVGPLRLDGRVVSVPYPSSFHWSAEEFGRGRMPPWQQFNDRPTRVYMVAGMHGKQRELRQRLVNDCKAAGKPLCIALTRFDESAMEDKQHAVFCLEPEGDRYGGLVHSLILSA